MKFEISFQMVKKFTDCKSADKTWYHSRSGSLRPLERSRFYRDYLRWKRKFGMRNSTAAAEATHNVIRSFIDIVNSVIRKFDMCYCGSHTKCGNWPSDHFSSPLSLGAPPSDVLFIIQQYPVNSALHHLLYYSFDSACTFWCWRVPLYKSLTTSCPFAEGYIFGKHDVIHIKINTNVIYCMGIKGRFNIVTLGSIVKI